MTNQLAKFLLLVALVLVLPLVLLAFTGESFADVVTRWQTAPPSPAELFLAIVAILAMDLVLPVPSGPISTFAGAQLGIFSGTLASTLGMTLGGLVAFALARRWGRPLAERFTEPEQIDDLAAMADTHGVWLTLITRPLPVLAEAAVLMAGAMSMRWRVFLPTLIASNLVISAAYATLGQTSATHHGLIWAICASIALPVILSLMARNMDAIEELDATTPLLLADGNQRLAEVFTPSTL